MTACTWLLWKTWLRVAGDPLTHDTFICPNMSCGSCFERKHTDSASASPPQIMHLFVTDPITLMLLAQDYEKLERSRLTNKDESV